METMTFVKLHKGWATIGDKAKFLDGRICTILGIDGRNLRIDLPNAGKVLCVPESLELHERGVASCSLLL